MCGQVLDREFVEVADELGLIKVLVSLVPKKVLIRHLEAAVNSVLHKHLLVESTGWNLNMRPPEKPVEQGDEDDDQSTSRVRGGTKIDPARARAAAAAAMKEAGKQPMVRYGPSQDYPGSLVAWSGASLGRLVAALEPSDNGTVTLSSSWSSSAGASSSTINRAAAAAVAVAASAAGAASEFLNEFWGGNPSLETQEDPSATSNNNNQKGWLHELLHVAESAAESVESCMNALGRTLDLNMEADEQARAAAAAAAAKTPMYGVAAIGAASTRKHLPERRSLRRSSNYRRRRRSRLGTGNGDEMNDDSDENVVDEDEETDEQLLSSPLDEPWRLLWGKSRTPSRVKLLQAEARIRSLEAKLDAAEAEAAEAEAEAAEAEAEAAGAAAQEQHDTVTRADTCAAALVAASTTTTGGAANTAVSAALTAVSDATSAVTSAFATYSASFTTSGANFKMFNENASMIETATLTVGEVIAAREGSVASFERIAEASGANGTISNDSPGLAWLNSFPEHEEENNDACESAVPVNNLEENLAADSEVPVEATSETEDETSEDGDDDNEEIDDNSGSESSSEVL